MTQSATGFSKPTPWQYQVVLHLLTVVPSNANYLEQAESMLVRINGESSQFDILVPGSEGTKGSTSRCLSLGKYLDRDGFVVEIALHERGGRLDLFERYKIGPSIVELEPQMSMIDVWLNTPKL